MDDLEPQPARQRHQRRATGAQQLHRHPAAQEVPLDLGAGLALEDQRRPQPGDGERGVRRGDLVQHLLLGDLVDAVVGGAHPAGRPGLVAPLRPGRWGVRADGGGDHEGARPGRDRRLRDVPRPLDVHPAQQVAVGVRLDQPGQMDHGVRAAQGSRELLDALLGGGGGADVDRGPLGAPVWLRAGLGQAAGDPQHGGDLRAAVQRGQHRGPGVPGGSDDGDSHDGLPRASRCSRHGGGSCGAFSSWRTPT